VLFSDPGSIPGVSTLFNEKPLWGFFVSHDLVIAVPVLRKASVQERAIPGVSTIAINLRCAVAIDTVVVVIGEHASLFSWKDDVEGYGVADSYGGGVLALSNKLLQRGRPLQLRRKEAANPTKTLAQISGVANYLQFIGQTLRGA